MLVCVSLWHCLFGAWLCSCVSSLFWVWVYDAFGYFFNSLPSLAQAGVNAAVMWDCTMEQLPAQGTAFLEQTPVSVYAGSVNMFVYIS
jgi:hypothetical protein